MSAESKPHKPAKFPHERYSDKWEYAANRLARSYAPDIYACHDCGAPYIRGNCCIFCESVNPEGHDSE